MREGGTSLGLGARPIGEWPGAGLLGKWEEVKSGGREGGKIGSWGEAKKGKRREERWLDWDKGGVNLRCMSDCTF